ncbi:MAG: hypothetical protein ABI813_01770 [Bacteroidota bacterium]
MQSQLIDWLNGSEADGRKIKYQVGKKQSCAMVPVFPRQKPVTTGLAGQQYQGIDPQKSFYREGET